MFLNDVQSKANTLSVASFEKSCSMEQIVDLIDKAVWNGTKISPAGTLHPMGGQQSI